ncbi:CPBP family intramembrane glutamic endopeptidase [Vulgatibacter incomptus]|uniref:CAAX amino terminal protease family protein n=1 Tax=Vulgatibacter incomptus TaxID=1391653 RepID=A0A0K1PEW9_9BACT|nr:type II CAAX endopeptidase family protein [Vulgatibacter incomptus]AKU91664.1 CAAX amino terminal protease family protein [Vulgatibacter incomptus]
MNPSSPSDEAILASRPAYVFLVAVLAIHLTIGSFVQVANPAFGIAFDELFVFAGLTIALVRSMNYRPAPFLAMRAPQPWAWPKVVLAAGAGFFAAGALNALNRLVVGPEISSRFDVTRLFEVRSVFEGVLLVAGVAVFAPFGEELLFRGYLMRVLRARYGWKGALFVTSALFAVVHFNPASVLALFGLGLVFGLIRLWTGSIWPSMLAHSIQNGVASALVLSGVSGQSPDELPGLEAIGLLAISAPFVVLALGLLRRKATPDPETSAVDEEAGHHIHLSRVARPLAIGVAAAVVAIVLLFVVDGKAVGARIGRKTAPQPAPSTNEPDHRGTGASVAPSSPKT